MKTRQNKKTGNFGENIAEKFLLKKGYSFIEKNFHAVGGEIDLIFKDSAKDEFVLVEVKTRKNKNFGNIFESINKQKIEKILLAAENFFLEKMELESVPDFRIDAVFVEITKNGVFCEHMQNIGLEDF